MWFIALCARHVLENSLFTKESGQTSPACHILITRTRDVINVMAGLEAFIALSHHFHSPSYYSHDWLLERWNSFESRQHYCLPCLPRVQRLYRRCTTRCLLSRQRDLYYSCSLGIPHLVSHPCPPPWYYHLSVLPAGKTCNHWWDLLEISTPRCT